MRMYLHVLRLEDKNKLTRYESHAGTHAVSRKATPVVPQHNSLVNKPTFTVMHKQPHVLERQAKYTNSN